MKSTVKIVASIIALLIAGNAAVAKAETLVQTYTNSAQIAIDNPGNGAIVPDSLFSASSTPFVRSGLSDAALSVTESFTGTLTASGALIAGRQLALQSTVELDGSPASTLCLAGYETAPGITNTTVAFNETASGRADYYTEFGGYLDPDFTGTDPVAISQVSGNPAGADAEFNQYVAALDGTLTVTETLT